MWDRRATDFIQCQDVAWATALEGEFGAGESQRVLSEDPTDGSRTVIMRCRNPIVGQLVGAVDVFVLEGSGSLNGIVCGAGSYFYLGEGSDIDFRPSVSRTTLYVGLNQSRSLVERGTINQMMSRPLHVPTNDVPWESPDWGGEHGVAPAVFHKVLRRSEAEEVRLIAMLPGHRSDEEERHEVCEESFRICGDLLFSQRGIMHAGAYFFHPPRVWHLPSGTRYGTMSLLRTNGRLTTEFRAAHEDNRWESLEAAGYANYPAPCLSEDRGNI